MSSHGAHNNTDPFAGLRHLGIINFNGTDPFAGLRQASSYSSSRTTNTLLMISIILSFIQCCLSMTTVTFVVKGYREQMRHDLNEKTSQQHDEAHVEPDAINVEHRQMRGPPGFRQRS